MELEPERTLARIRTYMSEGRLLDALEEVERFFQSGSEWLEHTRHIRELDADRKDMERLLGIARKLAGEIRGRMAEVVLAGAASPSLGKNITPQGIMAIQRDIALVLAGPGTSPRQRNSLRKLSAALG